MTDIYVDRAVQASGAGTSWGTAYKTIAEAVTHANGEPGPSTIHIAPGEYTDYGLTISKANVKILGKNAALEFDAHGLPTGPAPSGQVTLWKSASGTLLTVKASGFEVADIVFDGGQARQRALNPALLVVDGTATESLEDIVIRRNAFQDGKTGVSLRLANATIEENFIARNAAGFQALAGVDPNPNTPKNWSNVQLVTFNRNRVVDNLNVGATFAGHPALKSPLGQHGANDVVVKNNDFTGNGDGREPDPASPLGPSVYYPQMIQYSALLFILMNGDVSDHLRSARVRAKIHDNLFRRNGYAVAVGQRLKDNLEGSGYTLDATLAGNTYCANGLNKLCVDFGLIAQTHGLANGTFCYARATKYTITADDPLTLGDIDYDHPDKDPKVAPFGTVVLGNEFEFNKRDIEPIPYQMGPRITFRGDKIETGPKILSAAAIPASISPTGEMVPVVIAVEATDGCQHDLTYKIDKVTSNPPGPSADIDITDFAASRSLKLRAARTGAGDRVYTVTVGCAADTGQSSFRYVTRDVTVTVPMLTDERWCFGHALEVENTHGTFLRTTQYSILTLERPPQENWLLASIPTPNAIEGWRISAIMFRYAIRSSVGQIGKVGLRDGDRTVSSSKT